MFVNASSSDTKTWLNRSTDSRDLNNGRSDQKTNQVHWTPVDMTALDIVEMMHLLACQMHLMLDLLSAAAAVAAAAADASVVDTIVVAAAGKIAAAAVEAIAARTRAAAAGSVAGIELTSVEEKAWPVGMLVAEAVAAFAAAAAAAAVVAAVAVAVAVAAVAGEGRTKAAGVEVAGEVASSEELEWRLGQGSVELSSGKEYSTVEMSNWVAVEAWMISMVTNWQLIVLELY